MCHRPRTRRGSSSRKMCCTPAAGWSGLFSSLGSQFTSCSTPPALAILCHREEVFFARAIATLRRSWRKNCLSRRCHLRAVSVSSHMQQDADISSAPPRRPLTSETRHGNGDNLTKHMAVLGACVDAHSTLPQAQDIDAGRVLSFDGRERTTPNRARNRAMFSEGSAHHAW